MDYKSSGVDIDAGNEVVQRVKRLARDTFTPGVLSDIGAFGGLFQPSFDGMKEPVLVASADGVGTKLKVGFLAGKHNTSDGTLLTTVLTTFLSKVPVRSFFSTT